MALAAGPSVASNAIVLPGTTKLKQLDNAVRITLPALADLLAIGTGDSFEYPTIFPCKGGVWSKEDGT